MKRPLILAALLTSFVSSHVFARDTIANYPIQPAMTSEPGKIADDIGLYFAGQPHPAIETSLNDVATNRKTNAFGKSDLAACQHVFLSAMIALQDRAREEGGNAVVDIKSNYRNHEFVSPSEFTCGAGAVVAGTAFTGKIVKVRR